MTKVNKIKARQILDSRGNPTIEVDVFLDDNSFGRASVPSGASTGKLEAHELRDNDKTKFLGKGVLKAVRNVNEVIFPAISDLDPFNQRKIDLKMIEIDGTKNKDKIGANAILGTSLAIAKACANSLNKQLFQYIGEDILKKAEYSMPIPMMNIINGGSHADNKIDIQEFMIIPINTNSFSESVQIGSEIFHNLKSILKKSGHNTNVGDEGGFAPNLKSSYEALDLISQSVEKSGYKFNEDISLAIDAASSEFYKNGKYNLYGENLILNKDEIIKYYERLLDNYPISSIEDPMAEDDFDGWKNITDAIGNKVQLVGDDLFVTNPEILSRGIKEKMANAILIKPNQIGTLSETLDAINLAKDNNYKTIISHRSGETEDSTISHIAVGTNAGQIKIGSLSRSDRTAKYNELIRIEEIKNA